MTDDKVYDLPPTISKSVTCEDAISRKAVLSIFDEWFSTCNIADKRESPRAKINALLSVTPKQKTGKIIMGGYDCDHYICSECGHDFGWFSKPDYKYCPYCGIKLEGEGANVYVS